MTTTEIAEEHGVSRQTVHTYRKRGVFPKPVEGEGSTRPRFRADEVAAFFAANPPSPGKRTDLTNRDEGAAMWSTADPSEPGATLSREDQERLEETIRQDAERAALAVGLPADQARRVAGASAEGARGLLEEWRQQ